ncbi:KH domain-containing protein akap-1 [Chrysoperla carnea]|uniref:KH domain-containing protein akap-1 n=1 Tax=Chrysoperla carnea TaxID=189513 RepID=UPI001D077E77|nr:KH domain-containing protein akap-1 [Chrysoperla carnea]XP_044731538.1 KH domain-containing protein akap-1 [Chrysoperla carnea]XP_044731539.1 KH domain-containing protein akap-1 [Chrysoperla carnea]
MAPIIQSRQLLVWTIPSIAILLSFLWYKRKRSGPQSDPGEKEENIKENNIEVKDNSIENKTPEKVIKRSLSGVESSPIDIIIPHSLKSTKTPPVIISDKDLDKEIAKIKSMKSPFAETTNRKRAVRSALSVELEKTKTPPKCSNSPSDMSTPQMEKVSTKKENKHKQKGKKTIHKVETVSTVVEKLATMKLPVLDDVNVESSGGNNSSHCCSDRQSSERDSANHSPADVMLASPSLSSISDNHSEGSSDSGKGCSDVATPAGDGSLSGDCPQDQITVYEFVIAQNLVGRLIGRHGAVVQQIKNKTKANILIKRHPDSTKLKVCAVEGTQKEIDNALKMIRQKFPEKRYPSLTLEQVHFVLPPPTCTLIPECVYLKLVEGINNDTIISHVESPMHLFLQLHTHPSYPSLSRLVTCMNTTYKQPDSPQLPKPTKVNSIVAAPLNSEWYRATILSVDEENDASLVQFVDFGGYCNIENSSLRQIRGDFMTLPFQAQECILANLRLKSDETISPEFGIQFVDALTRGYLLQTQVVGYTPENMPCVFIYVVLGPGNIVFLNREVAEQGFADWVEEYKV